MNSTLGRSCTGYTDALPGRSSRGGFTIVELLVIISIIILLIALLLPALSNARRVARTAICKSNMHQLIVAVDAFANDDDGYFPPMQRSIDGHEVSWRAILYEYVAFDPEAFDCPAEEWQQYASGRINQAGACTGAPDVAPDAVGQVHPAETCIPSGIGAVNVHWNQGWTRFRPPFGRYDLRHTQYGTSRAPICRKSIISQPSEFIIVGDGNSSYTAKGTYYAFAEDAFWIYKQSALGAPGYSRANVPEMGFLPERGLERHGDEFDANYAMGDGSVQLLNAEDIPCDTSACWWDAQSDPH